MPDRQSTLDLLRPAVLLFCLLTIITGGLYPLLVTVIAQTAFPWQANGSLIDADGQPATAESEAAGSRLIGQAFAGPGYFWSRPSSTSEYPYNAAASGGSNLGPANPALATLIQERMTALQQSSSQIRVVPVDLVTASASGLDPHISPAAALYQVPRVAAARAMTEGAVYALVQRYTEGRMMGVFGESRVNVLLLNLALEQSWRKTDVPEGSDARTTPRS